MENKKDFYKYSNWKWLVEPFSFTPTKSIFNENNINSELNEKKEYLYFYNKFLKVKNEMNQDLIDLTVEIGKNLYKMNENEIKELNKLNEEYNALKIDFENLEKECNKYLKIDVNNEIEIEDFISSKQLENLLKED